MAGRIYETSDDRGVRKFGAMPLLCTEVTPHIAQALARGEMQTGQGKVSKRTGLRHGECYTQGGVRLQVPVPGARPTGILCTD